jgi:hypothetical protein
MAYKAIGIANICATLYTGDQRMFGAPKKPSIAK